MTPPPHGDGPSADRPASSGPPEGRGDETAGPAAPVDPPADALADSQVVRPEPSVPDASSAEPSGGTSGVADAEHNPSLNKLSRTLRRGATISAVMLFLTQLISLAQTVVVARLLTPAEIGVFTLGTLFANFLVVVAGGGMKAALIQRDTDVETAANTAFWASLVTGVAMSTGALLASPLLGTFFDDRMVALVAAATSGTLLIHSLLNVPEALMQRRFNFKRKLIVDPLTAGSFAIVTVVTCALGYGIWGMVIGLYASQVATLVASWWLAGWWPGKGAVSYRVWREMAGFAFPLIVQGLAKDVREIVQQSIVGRSLDIGTAGQYRYGRRIGILPGQAIIQIASYVLFPAFSRIADDAVRFQRGFLRALRLLWTATVPVGAFLVAAGGPAIVVLLGEQWAPAGIFVAAMAGFGPGTALNAVGVESIKGAGQSRRLHWVTGTSLVVGIGGLLALLPLGLLGVGLAVSLEGLVAGILTVALARPLVHVSWLELGRVLLPPVGAAVVAGGVTWALESQVLASDSRSVLLGLLFLLVDGLVFLGVYLAVLGVLAPATIAELRALVVKFLRRRRTDPGSGGGAGEAGAADGPDEGPDGPEDRDDHRQRLGEDDLLDAPTVVLGLRELRTEQLRRHPAPDPRAPTPLDLSPPTTPVSPAPPARASHDHGPTGHGPNGHGPGGHGAGGHGPGGHGPGGQPNGHGPHRDGAHGAGTAPHGQRPPGSRRRVVALHDVTAERDDD